MEIYYELCAVYSKNVMSEGTVRQWCRMFNKQQNVVSEITLHIFLYRHIILV
jgi:hypothetical protein